ncbi:CAP domain-containing protein [Pseudaestuariivita rosea]|uniref:CAP domain-containing protein n=1 Tax=Pseudaestuariivita rosea TaxID=2763263 RepID=UPI001ABAF6D1|nr:CAP domain-containing protein [Pseudaestuariivita rosea]
MLRAFLVSLILGFAVLGASAAEACRKANMPRGADRTIPTSNINQNLFSKAVLVEVNYQRCRAGLRPLRNNGNLVKAASGHSAWMAKARNLSHKSTRRGHRTVADRISRNYGNFSRASENIATVQRYWLDNGRTFYTKNLAECHFENGRRDRIPPHSYRSLAQWTVKLWVDSPSHRRNIMDRDVKHIGTAVQFDPRHKNCGAYYATQNFASK